MGIMMGAPHRLHGSVANGGKSPGMNTLASQPGQVTILSGLSLMTRSIVVSPTARISSSAGRPSPERVAHENRLLLAAQVEFVKALLGRRYQRSASAVVSRVLCKSGERVTGPVLIHTFKDAVENSFTAAASGESAHGANASTHFDKESFNEVGGAQPFPMSLGTTKEGQQFFQILLQTRDGLGC